MKILQTNLQTQFQLQTKMGGDVENDKQKLQYKNFELNSAWEK